MIEKAKTDQPRSLEDTLLFAQHFYHTSSEDTHTIAKRIQALHKHRYGWFGLLSFTSEIQCLPNSYQIKVQINYDGGLSDTTVVKAIGQIYQTDGVTTLSGKVSFGRLLVFSLAMLIIITLATFLIMWPLPHFPRWWSVITLGITVSCNLFLIFKIRETLHQHLEQTANTPDEKAKIA
jgi:hypothetical protein